MAAAAAPAAAAGAGAARCSPAAAAVKEAGNAAFAAGRFEDAYDRFSEALLIDPGSALLHSNRAGALSSLGRHAEALQDAERCAALEPEWWKGHTRRGHALFKLERFADSEQSYADALRLNPQERSISASLEQAAERRRAQGGSEGPRAAVVAGGPTGKAPVPVVATTAAFHRLSDQEIRQRLERGVQQLSDEALDAELLEAGIQLPLGATRRVKITLYLDAAAKGPAPTAKSSGPTLGERLLEQRRRWLEEWNSWDDARLVKRLRQLGIDGEGRGRGDLLEALLRAETAHFDAPRCAPRHLQVAGLVGGACAILGTFCGMALWLAFAAR